MKNLTLNLASVMIYNTMMESRGQYIEYSRYAIVGALSELFGIADDESAVEMVSTMRAISGLIQSHELNPDDVKDGAVVSYKTLNDFIRCYLLNANGDGFRNALTIMALFAVYTIAVDTSAVGQRVTVSCTELRDNIGKVVERYMADGFYGETSLANTMHETIGVMECGSRYHVYVEGVLTAAKNFAYGKTYKVAR